MPTRFARITSPKSLYQTTAEKEKTRKVSGTARRQGDATVFWKRKTNNRQRNAKSLCPLARRKIPAKTKVAPGAQQKRNIGKKTGEKERTTQRTSQGNDRRGKPRGGDTRKGKATSKKSNQPKDYLRACQDGGGRAYRKGGKNRITKKRRKKKEKTGNSRLG